MTCQPLNTQWGLCWSPVQRVIKPNIVAGFLQCLDNFMGSSSVCSWERWDKDHQPSCFKAEGNPCSVAGGIFPCWAALHTRLCPWWALLFPLIWTISQKGDTWWLDRLCRQTFHQLPRGFISVGKGSVASPNPSCCLGGCTSLKIKVANESMQQDPSQDWFLRNNALVTLLHLQNCFFLTAGSWQFSIHVMMCFYIAPHGLAFK